LWGQTKQEEKKNKGVDLNNKGGSVLDCCNKTAQNGCDVHCLGHAVTAKEV